MNRQAMRYAAAVAGLLAASPALAAGDSVAGHDLAQRWCSSCHLVDRAGQGSDTASPFAAIARKHAANPDWVRGWLAAPHPPMPNLSLTRQQIDDIAAYLGSLPAR